MRPTFLSARGWLLSVCVGLLLAAGARQARADEPKPETRPATPRDIVVEAVNPLPAFQVRVSVDRPERVYREGEVVKATVLSEREGYLYLFYLNAEGKASVIFPNKRQADNKIPANKPIDVPAPGAAFVLRVKGPFGSEFLKALVTTAPIKEGALDADKLARQDFTVLKKEECEEVVKGLEVEPVTRVESGQGSIPVPEQGGSQAGQHKFKKKYLEWAEHQCEITTLPSEGKPQQKPDLHGKPQQGPAKERRVGVFIGISKYQDKKIRPLKVADQDARQMADVMQQKCRLDEAVVLTNEQATLQNIEQTIRMRLVSATRPGDTIILYWSGHGARISNTDGTEPDGFDEYLVPYDGQLGGTEDVRRTMLIDKTFGRWVQELDGRKIIVILDACHAGGQAQGAPKELALAKGLGAFDPKGDKEPKGFQRKTVKAFDGAKGIDPNDLKELFFARSFRSLSKDIGQKEAAVLASCKASEISFERDDGKGSVMTYFLVRCLEEKPGPLTLENVYSYLDKEVPVFVKEKFPGSTQTPVLADQTTPPTFLKPSER
jgi:hypothetical protein